MEGLWVWVRAWKEAGIPFVFYSHGSAPKRRQKVSSRYHRESLNGKEKGSITVIAL
jgi:hypothetical protein